MSIAAIVEALFETGASREQIIAALRAHAAQQEKENAERRAAAAKRVAAHRARKKAADVTCVTVTSVTDPALIDSKKGSPPSPPTGAHPPQGDKRARRKSIPDDFEPDIDAAVAEGLPVELARREAQSLRDWAKSKGETKADWAATWRVWYRRKIADFQRGPPVRLAYSNDSPRPQSSAEEMFHAAQRHLARLSRNDGN
jgi:hypothetical protein